MTATAEHQDAFKKLKAVCVPLLGASLLTPKSVPTVSALLSSLIQTLHDIDGSNVSLTPSLISYAFFPLSTILGRNASAAIPDQVLEKLLIVLSLLCESWWWDCDLAVWEQIFMLCGSVIGGIDGKGKGKTRDDETKEAAASCLLALLRDRKEDMKLSPTSLDRAKARTTELQSHARGIKFVPILGQTLDSLLSVALSRRLSLQRSSLELLYLLIDIYAPDDLIPSVLPGVVSGASKVALGIPGGKGWANGDIVASALKVIEVVVIKSIGDDLCIKEGALRYAENLEDLVIWTEDLQPTPTKSESRSYATPRTSSWLRGTSSQLHIAINALTPLVAHPTPSALLALSRFSSAVLSATPLSLPQTQPLLLSFLLSLSLSPFPTASNEARVSLLKLLTTPRKSQSSLLQTLMRSTKDNLAALPRLLSARADAKTEHTVGLIEAVCRLATIEESPHKVGQSISLEIGKLLGPSGGVERWGWSLLSVLELEEPSYTTAQTSAAQLVLESDPDNTRQAPFPEFVLKNGSSSSTLNALERMLLALGRAGGDSCLFSVEWFTSIGRRGTGSRSVAAIWCACRLLQGIAKVSLSNGTDKDSTIHKRSKRLDKFSRALARNTADLWNDVGDEIMLNSLNEERDQEEDVDFDVKHIKGLVPISDNLKISRSSPAKAVETTSQPILHKALSLEILAVSAGILQAQFTPLYIYTLYPVLHSLVSPIPHLSSTALATLNFFTMTTSYASPANLLFSNFDYVLDAVSRRFTRRWLDVDATRVLAIMIRLVGSDVVEKAGDVVEECFDRLDEFHGYDVIVEGLIEVLGEVVQVIKVEAEATSPDMPDNVQSRQNRDTKQLNDFFDWFSRRHERHNPESDTTDYGPAPREAWGEDKEEDAEEKAAAQEPDPNADPPSTPIQALTKQIVSRSLYFLTHKSPTIRARILKLLSASVPVLPGSALLPSIHSAWPFILNRLADSESFVVSAAVMLIEALVSNVGTFMYRRIWDDVWPRFRVVLANLDAADATNALSRRGRHAVGTESAYTHSHRLYKSLLKTMTATVKGVDPQDSSLWQVILAFRRFLHIEAHEDLQQCARDLYLGLGVNNADAVWLVLSSTSTEVDSSMRFMREHKWDIEKNAAIILERLDMEVM